LSSRESHSHRNSKDGMRLTTFALALLAAADAFHVPAVLPHKLATRAPALSRVAPPALSADAADAAAFPNDPPLAPPESILEKRLPIVKWLPKALDSPLADVISGLTVATMLIPQGMAYATLAGLEPIVGLYCYVPLLVYALLGSSSFLAVGPVALVSTTVMGMISHVAGPARLALASALMFACGALSTVLGVLGLAKVVDYVPKEVLSAFTTGAAFNIMFTQLGSLFQIKVAASHAPIVMLKNAIVALPTLQPFTTALSACAIGMLLALKKLPLHSWLKLKPSVPKSIFGDLGPFATMVTFTLLNSVLGLTAMRGIAEVGVVPSGLPSFSSPLGVSLAGHYKDIAVLTFVMLVETMAIGKALAAKAGQTINNRQEFIAVGASNMLGSFFNAYTCAGSFSRSAVVVSTGGKSQLAGIVTAASVVLTLKFLTPFFTHVPKAVLASCLIVAVSSLVDTKRISELWTQSKGRLALYMVYVASMLVFGAAEGLMASVALFYATDILKKLAIKAGLRGE